MRRGVWSCVCLIVVIGALSSCGWAVERELCGVRLGDKALSLLDKPGYGQPAYIGPLGTISVAPPQQQQAGGGAAAASARSGPAGPSSSARGSGMRGGARGGGMRGGRRGGGRRGGMAAAPGLGTLGVGGDLQIVLTGRGGMGGRGGRRGGGGARGGMRGGTRGGGGARGGRAAARAGGGATGLRGRPGAGAAGVEGPGMFWYYRRPGGAVIVFTLSMEGEITAITLAGIAPTPGGRTTRGIGLGHGYMDLIGQYGYPDQSVSSGTTLEMTYVDHGVRFALDSMRVRQIEIGAAIAAAAEVAPAAPEAATPPAGMSTEELRGYL